MSSTSFNKEHIIIDDMQFLWAYFIFQINIKYNLYIYITDFKQYILVLYISTRHYNITIKLLIVAPSRSPPPKHSNKFNFFDKSFIIGKPSIEAAGRLFRFVKDQNFFQLETYLRLALSWKDNNQVLNKCAASYANHANRAHAI